MNFPFPIKVLWTFTVLQTLDFAVKYDGTVKYDEFA